MFTQCPSRFSKSTETKFGIDFVGMSLILLVLAGMGSMYKYCFALFACVNMVEVKSTCSSVALMGFDPSYP